MRQNQVFFEDALLGEVAPAAFTKFQPLFTTLKENRERWKEKHPGQNFPGRSDLAASGSITCAAGFSVLATSAFAGYPNQSLKIDATQRQELAYAVPGPPMPDEGQPRIDDLFLHFRNDGRVDLAWTRCNAKTVESIAPSGMTDALAKHCATNPSACFNTVLIRCEPGAVFGAVGEALAGVQRSGLSRVPVSVAARQPDCNREFGFKDYLEERDSEPVKVATDAERARVKLVEEPFEITGSLDREAVAKGLRGAWNAAEDCYVAALRRNPNLEGRIRMRLNVARGGDVVGSWNRGADLPDGAAVSCILKAFDGRDLGRPARGTAVVNYGLRLSARGNLP